MALIYLSHPIGDGGTLTEIEKAANKKRAYQFVGRLREMFPNIGFFCPAEAEIFVSKALKDKYLSLEQVLTIDCEIIKECEGLIAYTPNGNTSKGMDIEIEFAHKEKLPVLNLFYGDDIKDDKLFLLIENFIMECIDG